MKAWRALVKAAARKEVRIASNALAVIFFLLFVVTPTIYVLTYVVTDWGEIKENVLEGDTATLVWKMNETAGVTGYDVFVVDGNRTLDEFTQHIGKPKETTTVLTGLPDNDDISFRVEARYGQYDNGTMVSDSDGPSRISAIDATLNNGTFFLNLDSPANRTSVIYTNIYPGNGTLWIENAVIDGDVNFTGVLDPSRSGLHFIIRRVGPSGAITDSARYHITDGGNLTVAQSTCAPQLTVYGPESTLGFIWESVAYSFEIAIIVTIIDVIFGFPMAWLLVRKKFWGRQALDTLIDLPLAIPTAALGFSTALFWVATTGEPPPLGNAGIVSSAFVLMLLLHIVFTYPYMVRSLAAILEEIDVNYETAAGTLGASRITMLRTVTLPLFKSGLVTGMVLCLARSLSETGGTMIALSTMGKVQEFQTAPVAIGVWKAASHYNEALVPAMAFASVVLIVVSLALLVALKLTLGAARFPLPRVFPSLERGVSAKPVKLATYVLNLAFMAILVLIPSAFIVTYLADMSGGSLDWPGLWRALGYSFAAAFVVTVADLVAGVPLAILISRGRFRWLSEILDVLVNVPLVVPTAALGFSLGLFFSDMVSLEWAFGLIVLSHIAFTYPLVVRNMTGALDGLDTAYEDAAKTLGAKPLDVFKTVVLPLVRPSLLAGSIMAFTRSLGETGATLAVVAGASTVPVFIVNLVKAGDYQTAAAACIVLMAVSFLLILVTRYTLSREVRREW